MKKVQPMTSVADAAARPFCDTRGVNPPLDLSATFKVPDSDDFGRWFMGKDGVPEGSYLYARQSHPAAMHLGQMVAALEGAEAGHVTASGLSACGAALLRYAGAGDTLVLSNRLYGGMRALSNFFTEHLHIKVIPVEITDIEKVKRACSGKRVRALFTEVASNPDLVVADLSQLALVAHARGIPLIVDNTFTPLAIRPIALGADVVVHSLTKYASGTSKVMAGALVGKRDVIRSMIHPTTGVLMLLGPVLAPEVADKLREHLPSLQLRFIEASRRAHLAATSLERSGFSVCYPGLTTSPGYDCFVRMETMRPGDLPYGKGGVLSVVLPSYTDAKRFTELLVQTHFAQQAVSLGSSHTYVLPYGSDDTFSPLWKKPLPFAPLPQGIIRISMGYEGEWADMNERLADACLQFGK